MGKSGLIVFFSSSFSSTSTTILIAFLAKDTVFLPINGIESLEPIEINKSHFWIIKFEYLFP